MAFDPSVISDIGASGPDVAGSIAKGFQLKDLVQEHDMNQLRLSSMRTEAEDSAKAKEILKHSDLTTMKGATEASEKLTRAGMAQKGLDLRKQAQTIESGEYEIQNQKIANLHAQAEQINSIIEPVMLQAQNIKDPATAQAFVRAQAPLMIMAIKDNQALDPQTKQAAIQKIQQEMSSQDPYGALKSGHQLTKETMGRLKFEMDQRNINSEIENRNRTRQQEDEKIVIEKQKLALQKGNAGLDSMYAAFADVGIQIPGRSKQTQDSTMRGLIAKYPDKSPDEIAQGVKNGQISMSVAKTEGSVLGRREAAILPVEKSITRPGGFLDQAEKAVNSVDFPRLKAAGEFSKWTKEQESDPDLSRYKAAVAELRAEYSIVLSKGGQVTDAARHEAEKVIPDLITKDQFKAIKQVVLQGIESSKGGVESSISEVSGKPAATPAAANNDPLGIR